MINKKLLSFDRAALRYVGANVAFQWLGLVCVISSLSGRPHGWWGRLLRAA